MYVHYYGYSCIRYISYEFLGLSEAVQCVPWDMVRVHEYKREGTKEDC